MNFLAGSYDILARTLILDYLSSQMKEKHFDIKESSFYLGIYEIIALADEDVPKQQNLLFAFMKIIDAAKDASHLTLPLIIPLFYHEPFRKLYAAALRLYWQDSEDLFEGSLLAFNGMENTKVYLQELREQIASNHDKMLIERLRRTKLLYQFEKSAHERDCQQQSKIDPLFLKSAIEY